MLSVSESKVTFKVVGKDHRDTIVTRTDELDLEFEADRHTLFDLVNQLCRHWIHAGRVIDHLWTLSHGKKRYVGPHGKDFCEFKNDIGVDYKDSPLLSKMGLTEGSVLRLAYNISDPVKV